jgi:hypothetical protein
LAELTIVGMMVVETRIGPLTELERSEPEYIMSLHVEKPAERDRDIGSLQ